MSYGKASQIERQYDYVFDSKRGVVQHSHKYDKLTKNRVERHRAKRNPECMPQYRKFDGWEW